jgi:hypothetical protein
MDNMVTLAKLFKDRNNPTPMGVIVGKVESVEPNWKIRIGDHILLENRHLIFSEHVLKGYKREYKGIVKINKSDAGTTSDGSTVLLNLDSEFEGEIEWVDTLKKGDDVILVPATNENSYYVIDKAVRY